jgi:hypothetical protein
VAGPRHAAHPRIVAIQHLHAERRRVTKKDRRLRPGIGIESVVAIEVVVGYVQHGGGGRKQGPRGFELEAGQFEHPDLWQSLRVLGIHQRRQRGG